MERIDEILNFWFGDGSDPEHERLWFAQDACRIPPDEAAGLAAERGTLPAS